MTSTHDPYAERVLLRRGEAAQARCEEEELSEASRSPWGFDEFLWGGPARHGAPRAPPPFEWLVYKGKSHGGPEGRSIASGKLQEVSVSSWGYPPHQWNNGIFPHQPSIFWGSPIYGNPRIESMKKTLGYILDT